MNIIIADTLGASDTIQRCSIFNDPEPLLITLREAAQRAAQLQRSVLASFTLPLLTDDTQSLEWLDPLRVFHAARLAGLGECFFWEQPAQRKALVGVDAAKTIETSGAASLSAAATAWRNLLRDAVVMHAAGDEFAYGSGPVLFGGFAFDPLSSRTELWRGFPDGLLILPSVLISYSGGGVALTVNRMVQGSEDVEECVEEIVAGVGGLLAALETTPPRQKGEFRGTPPSLIVSRTALTPAQGTASPAPLLEGEVREGGISAHDLLPTAEWMELVAKTVSMIREGAYEKVVLARGLQVRSDVGAFDVDATLEQLRQSYASSYVFAIQRGERFFVGATPERLVQAQDGQIHTMALAGSAPRGASEEEDAKIGAELLLSEKNYIEHALVIEMVRETLLAHCSEVHISDKPRLLKLKNVQHLETPIAGELMPGQCILDVLADLHPTPAVGGFPNQAALEAIRDTEKLDRGWYAGPLGWIGASGHGEFAVALRSGLIDGEEATLFAGCGIVAESDPQSEYDESCLKFEVMLRSLGGKG